MSFVGGMIRSLTFNNFLRVTGKGKFGKMQSRGLLTPKRSPKQYYKGKGCRSLGFVSRKGKLHQSEDDLSLN